MVSDINLVNLVNAVIVGDGYITKRGAICFKHSIVQENYVEWKVNLLKEAGLKFIKPQYREPSGYGTNRTITYMSSCSSWGKSLRKKFYPEDKKIVPNEVFENFSWREWAILFQDDGRCNKISHYNTKKNGKKERIECNPFTNRYEFCFPKFNDNEMFASIKSLSNLGVEARIGFHKKLGQRLLWITKSREKEKFYDGVMSHMCETMKYKLGVAPSLKRANEYDTLDKIV